MYSVWSFWKVHDEGSYQSLQKPLGLQICLHKYHCVRICLCSARTSIFLLSAPIPSTKISPTSCVSDTETLKQLVKNVQKIQELLEIAFVPANSEPSDSEYESFSSAAMTSSSKLSSLSTGTNSFLYSLAASSTQSSQPSSTLSGVSSGCRRKLWKKSE